eukprot:jgi/Chrzof1/14979/Cz09g23010.t1
MWTFSTLTILPVAISFLPVILTKDLPKIPNTHVDVISGAAAAGSFIAELFMIKALLVYDASDRNGQESHSKPRHKPMPTLAFAVVVVLGVLLTITAFLLLMALDYMPDIPSRILYCCLSLSCLLIAASTTYGLGGFLRYGKTADSGTMWQFFQPFSGGTAFVATQAIGWSLFSTTIVLIVVMVQQLISGVAHCIRCWALGAGCLAVTAQALLGLSLLFFQGKAARQLIRTASASLQISTAQSWLGLLMPIVLMYTPVHVFFTLWTLSYTFLPVKWAVSLWVAFLVPYYGFTVVGHPHHTGGAMGLGYTLNKLVST